MRSGVYIERAPIPGRRASEGVLDDDDEDD